MESFHRGFKNIIMDLTNNFILKLLDEKATMQEGFKIDKNLPNRLDNLSGKATYKET